MTQKTVDLMSRSAAFLSAADPRFKIHYFFPHAKQNLEDASPFGWYTEGILATAWPMKETCALPADLREINSETQFVLIQRLVGGVWPHLFPIEIDSLNTSLSLVHSPFIVCVTTDPQVAAETDAILKGFPTPTLHISSIAGANRIPPESYDFDCVCFYVRKVLDAIANDPIWRNFVRSCRGFLSESKQRRMRKHPLELGLHNVTAPNEIALSAFGYKFPKTKRISLSLDFHSNFSADNYIERICQSADYVASERRRLLPDRMHDMADHKFIIAVGSADALLYSNWKKIVQRAPVEIRSEYRRALTLILRNESYYHPSPTDKSGRPSLGALGHSTLKEIGRDMNAFTAALSILSSATLCPVLRLEPKINKIRVDAAELARCVRAYKMPHHVWKQARMMRLLGEKMRSLINTEFLKRIDAKEISRIEGMKLITDLPLELLPSNGVPLGLRFDTSRISPLPGNLFWQTCKHHPIGIPAQKFYDILIIRSFDKSDPIRLHLENGIRFFDNNNNFKRVKYEFVDVNSVDQFVNSVNKFKGAVMIFDGHGMYDAALGSGCLVIGGKPLDTWSIKEFCRLPPVVMFSACDTQPIDGTHSSVATSAFALGARAVLGTLLPVNAREAAIMMARMLFRIDQFLPAAASSFRNLNWRHIVSGMLRMSHTTEATRTLNIRANLGLTDDALARIQMKANMEINSWSSSWYDDWIAIFGKEAGKSEMETRNLIAQHVGITDAMKYVQLGNPERVFIINN